MSSNTSGPTDPTDEEAFQRALSELVHAAAENGVVLEGGWSCRTDRDDRPDWDVEIFRMGKK